MKRALNSFFAFCVLLVAPIMVSAQGGPHELYIPQPAAGEYLNDLIMSDSLPNGQRVDPLRVYVLQRGAIYIVRTNIRNQGWVLRIKAANATGPKPAIFLQRNTVSGAIPGRMVDVASDLWLQNLVIAGWYEADPLVIGDINGSLVEELTTAGAAIVIDSCVLTSSSGQCIRTTAASRIVRVTNTIFANMGYLGTSNLGAGKGIDVRNVSCDSLIMVNNTFVNYQDRVIRHFASTANIQFLKFEHNTLANGMSYHGLLSLGRIGHRAIINNNLLVDAFALGNDTDAVRQAEFTDSGEPDQFGFPRMTWVMSNPNDSTVWTVQKNYFSISPAQQSFWDSASILPIVANPPLTPGAGLTHHISSRIGADSLNAFQRLDVTLANIPRLMTAMMKWYRRPTSSGGAGKTKATTNFSAGFDYDRRIFAYYRDTLDCSYPTSSPLYTAALGGYPVGDLNWFPSRKHDWEIDPISAVEPIGDIPTTFALAQNFPNPFNPATKITFTLEKAGLTTLTVYNILGQKVATVLAKDMTAGTHEVTFDASSFSSGMYFYKLDSGARSDVKKMMLLK